MGVRHLRWLACCACALALLACGDDGGSGPDDGIDTERDDAGPRAGRGGSGGRGGEGGDDAPRAGRGGGGSGGERDAGMDAMAPNPFDYDASGDYNSIPPGEQDAGPPPDTWVCPLALWSDEICDCSCGAIDPDCAEFSCTEPGCIADSCDACFTASQTWKPCEPAPSASDWTCDLARLADAQCDCGCGIDDPACQGSGCSEPGCRLLACDRRNGCTPGTLTDVDDDCTFVNPDTLTDHKWKCAWDHYGSGDGCHCGCGAKDPDCDGQGCTAARCFDLTCDVCSDENGRPYPCAAAEGGWDDDAEPGVGGRQLAQCDPARFGAGDGCDCGCGGADPDCGENAGCVTPGCIDDACDRCTDTSNGAPYPQVGCAPATWVDETHQCKLENYGTGDGCDCGCGDPDPDCGAALGCTTPGCTHAACDVCNDGGFYEICTDRWTCTHPDVFNSSACDCGCGVIDPACRDAQRLSCTEAGCETEACDYCNDGGDRSACGGAFGPTNVTCSLEYYGIDGLCDCGCGALDPDCGEDAGCTEPGCNAPGCEVCHGGNSLSACREWTCDGEGFGTGDGCDCGCGAPDPDCGNGGCEQPGCDEPACITCHDPFGRAVECR